MTDDTIVRDADMSTILILSPRDPQIKKYVMIHKIIWHGKPDFMVMALISMTNNAGVEKADK